MAFGEQERGRPAPARNSNDAIGSSDGTAHRLRAANYRIAGVTLISASLAVFVAATYPGPLVLSTLSSLLLLVAATSAVVAFLFRQSLAAPHLTLWDKAAALLALGVVISLEVDGAAMQAFLDAQEAARTFEG